MPNDPYSPIIFSVDVESDWGRGTTRGIHEALPRLLALLERYDACATFFVVGELATEFAAVLPPGSRHEIGSHSMTHAMLPGLALDMIRNELVASRQQLEDRGYTVRGFRAPFLRSPPELPRLLCEAGYAYDASTGALHPSLKNRRAKWRHPAGTMPRLGLGCLRCGLIPFNLTWLRLLHPLGLGFVPRQASVFLCHLHELLDSEGGWHRLWRPLRRIHARRCGPPAWDILERLLAARSRPCISFSKFLKNPDFLRKEGARSNDTSS